MPGKSGSPERSLRSRLTRISSRMLRGRCACFSSPKVAMAGRSKNTLQGERVAALKQRMQDLWAERGVARREEGAEARWARGRGLAGWVPGPRGEDLNRYWG